MKLNNKYGKGGLSGGPLGYAKKGQLTVRPQAHGGKPGMKMRTGIYPGSNKSSTKGK